jgi:hypothetical protein
MSNALKNKTLEFRKKLEKLPKEDLLEIIKMQDVDTLKEINRIEWVFRNKLQHLTWADGSTITERDITNRELALLVDEPFELDYELLDMRNNRRAAKATAHS